TDSDTPDTPPSPTHGTPFTEITSSTQRSPNIPRQRVMILVPRQPIPHDYFSPDDSARDSSSDLSSDASLVFHSDASSDSSSRHSLSDHSSPDLSSTYAGPSRKRRRSPITFIPALSPIFGAISPVRADLIPSPKRVRDSGYLADIEVDPRETSLMDDVIVRGSDEPHLEQDIDPKIQVEIDECIAYADALRDRGIDARVVVEAVDREESKTGTRGLVEVRVERVTHPAMLEDTTEPAQKERVVEYYFSPDDSARDSFSDSSSDASLVFHSDASSDSSSRHSLSDHSSPDLPSTYAGPSRKRRRSPITFVPALSPVFGAISPVRADLIPSPKRVRDSGYLADIEVDPRETSLMDDVIVRGSDEPHLEQDIDPKIQVEIDECIAYADALRDRGIDARVVVEAVDREKNETGTRGLVEVRVERVTHPAMLEDTIEPAQKERVVECTHETLESLGHRIVGVESAVDALTERIAELESDNRRLRGTVSVEGQRVDRL
nr:hypothetical protein [Tanacetum cinerariifolium]